MKGNNMSVKLFNATAQQMAKAIKKQAKKSPELLKQAPKLGFTKANGKLSTKKIKAGLIEELGADCFTKSGKLNKKGRVEMLQEGVSETTTLKKFVKAVADKQKREVEAFAKAAEEVKKAAAEAAKNAKESELAKLQAAAKNIFENLDKTPKM